MSLSLGVIEISPPLLHADHNTYIHPTPTSSTAITNNLSNPFWNQVQVYFTLDIYFDIHFSNTLLFASAGIGDCTEAEVVVHGLRVAEGGLFFLSFV